MKLIRARHLLAGVPKRLEAQGHHACRRRLVQIVRRLRRGEVFDGDGLRRRGVRGMLTDATGDQERAEREAASDEFQAPNLKFQIANRKSKIANLPHCFSAFSSSRMT